MWLLFPLYRCLLVSFRLCCCLSRCCFVAFCGPRAAGCRSCYCGPCRRRPPVSIAIGFRSQFSSISLWLFSPMGSSRFHFVWLCWASGALCFCTQLLAVLGIFSFPAFSVQLVWVQPVCFGPAGAAAGRRCGLSGTARWSGRTRDIPYSLITADVKRDREAVRLDCDNRIFEAVKAAAANKMQTNTQRPGSRTSNVPLCLLKRSPRLLTADHRLTCGSTVIDTQRETVVSGSKHGRTKRSR